MNKQHAKNSLKAYIMAENGFICKNHRLTILINAEISQAITRYRQTTKTTSIGYTNKVCWISQRMGIAAGKSLSKQIVTNLWTSKEQSLASEPILDFLKPTT
jgi:hypothetical protein